MGSVRGSDDGVVDLRLNATMMFAVRCARPTPDFVHFHARWCPTSSRAIAKEAKDKVGAPSPGLSSTTSGSADQTSSQDGHAPTTRQRSILAGTSTNKLSTPTCSCQPIGPSASLLGQALRTGAWQKATRSCRPLQARRSYAIRHPVAIIYYSFNADDHSCPWSMTKPWNTPSSRPPRTRHCELSYH